MTEPPLIISVDDHVVEPPDLWTSRLPARYQRATDLYSNQTHAVRENAIELVVPFEGVSVLRLE